MMKRGSGVLMPVTSLPSDYGIGTMGKQARLFVDFLKKAGQQYWQVLPLGPTSYGDSPYQSFSSFAGNPYLIDLDMLAEQGLLKKAEYKKVFWGSDPLKVDYGTIYYYRFKVLKKAADRMKEDEYFASFCEHQAYWLEDYALFMALKDAQGGKAWSLWPAALKNRRASALDKARRELKEEILFWKKLQYLFELQWHALKEYAHEKGVRIIGDAPIYAAMDSADVWASPKLFQLDGNGDPIDVAGCPPDAFSADGQLWGNPLYDWPKMKKDGYKWWIRRIRRQMEFYDVLRIDHFRGFAGYYSIPYGEKTARNGRWVKGPGIDFFKTLNKELGELELIAEDLGFLTDDVLKMLKEAGYPGMKVLEFGFDGYYSNSPYMPHTFPQNCVVYPGTHDNDTIMGWMETMDEKTKDQVVRYFRLDRKEGYNWGVIRGAWSSPAVLAVTQFQDMLGLGSEGRINVPSTTGTNWLWRCQKTDFKPALAKKLRELTELYGRLG